MARIHEVIEDLFGPEMTEDAILEAFRCEHPGFTSHTMPLTVYKNGVLIRGDFNTSTYDCSNVGYFERWLHRAGQTLVAYHANIYVEDRFRKQGLAKHHLSKLLAFYDSVGIEYVYLDALGYGSIVWPQLGFELREPPDKQLLDTHFRSIAEEIGYEIEPPARAPALALTPPVDGVEIGLEALDRTYRALGERPIPMILDLKDGQTRAFLDARGILTAKEGR